MASVLLVHPMGLWTKRALAGAAVVAVFLACTQAPEGPAVVTVNPGTTFQKMLGWEVVPNIGAWECISPQGDIYFPANANDIVGPVVDLVASLGVNRVRVPVRPSAEQPTDVWADFQSSKDYQEYRSVWYRSVNDNDDPNSINPAGFHFSELQFHLDHAVVPLRQRLADRGESLYVVLNFINFGRGLPPFQHVNAPAEYAEFMLAAFDWMRDRYGFVPDAIEVINEPDNGTIKWTAEQIGNIIRATGDRLAAAGYRPDFVAPSTANMQNAVTYFDQMIRMERVGQYLSEFSYHRYGGVTNATLQAIGDRARKYGLRTGMLEHIDSGYDDLIADLRIGLNSSWEQYSTAACGMTGNPGGRLIMFDLQNPSSATPTNRAKYLKHFYAYVRRDAVRVEATSSRPALDPLAFVNANGTAVVVVKALESTTFSVAGLPEGRYGSVYTLGPSDASVIRAHVEGPDVTIGPGQTLPAAIPGRGLITIYAK